MESARSDDARRIGSLRYRTAALATALAGGLLGSVAELGTWIDGATNSSWARLPAFLIISATAGYQLLRSRRTEAAVVIAGLTFACLSLVEIKQMSGYDSGNTLAFLILLSVIYITTRENQTKAPLIVGSGLIALFTIVSVLIEVQPASQAIAKLMVGIPGQMLVVWIMWRLIESLAEASRLEKNRARIQEALATCSQALLIGRDREPLAGALTALLDATEADYAYVDINRVESDGTITWQIVADAYGDNVPPGPESFDQGDYSQYPFVVELLSSGQPARIQVSKLEMPVRARYEAEGIRSELAAPIMIRDQWVGTLGYSDFWRDDAWTDVEVEGLMRAADMVSAYWEREQAREGLEELAESKDRFIATVSHELRTPLSAVVGFSGELAQHLDQYTRDEVLEMVDLISSQSIEVAQLVDDLLTAERAASGNLTVNPTTIDLLDEARSIVESLRMNDTVTVDGESVQAWADTLRSRQIVRNLLTNANRYGGGKVRIEISTSDDRAVLVVTDNGQGVPEIEAEHIFDPYYRLRTEDTRPESVGLGLAVARQLARLMDGDLVYRRLGGWTRFELTLPTVSTPAVALAG
jgi:signal transduction histidine kinase